MSVCVWVSGWVCVRVCVSVGVCVSMREWEHCLRGKMIYDVVAMTAIEGEDCLPTPVVSKIDFDKEHQRVRFINNMLIHHKENSNYHSSFLHVREKC